MGDFVTEAVSVNILKGKFTPRLMPISRPLAISFNRILNGRDVTSDDFEKIRLVPDSDLSPDIVQLGTIGNRLRCFPVPLHIR